MKQDNDIDREEVPVGEPLADAPDEAAAGEVGNLKRQAVNSVLWRIFETGGRQVIFFIISVVLARLILPESYGTVAMLTIFTTVANAFIDSGFSTALIRKTDRTQTDCSTVFWFNILVALLCYAILFLSAPLIARFYDMPVLTPVLRVSAISLVIGSIAGVQRALLTAELRFKLLAKLNIAGLLLSGAAGILLAYLDFQVWALVWNGIIGTTVSTILIWIYGKWRPTLEFSRQSFKEFFSFGSKLLASGLLDTFTIISPASSSARYTAPATSPSTTVPRASATSPPPCLPACSSRSPSPPSARSSTTTGCSPTATAA